MKTLPHIPKRPSSEARAHYWLEHQPEHRTVYFNANHKWHLRGFDKNGLVLDFLLPEGQYELDFPKKSASLTLMIIDPDPGGGGLVE